MIRPLLALVLAGTLPVVAQSVDLPEPPAGQVLDPSAWLTEDLTERLRTELTRIREAHSIDALMVIWTRPLPADTTLDDLAHRLGETWGREELWTVTLYAPDSDEQPAVAVGGPAAASIPELALIEALDDAIDRAAREPAAQEQVTAVALETVEELIFLAQPEPSQTPASAPPAPVTQASGSLDVRLIALAGAGGLVVLTLAGLITFALLRRRPAAQTFEFPETRWRQRLGGQWSGGSCATATIPSKP